MLFRRMTYGLPHQLHRICNDRTGTGFAVLPLAREHRIASSVATAGEGSRGERCASASEALGQGKAFRGFPRRAAVRTSLGTDDIGKRYGAVLHADAVLQPALFQPQLCDRPRPSRHRRQSAARLQRRARPDGRGLQRDRRAVPGRVRPRLSSPGLSGHHPARAQRDGRDAPVGQQSGERHRHLGNGRRRRRRGAGRVLPN
jgi:hypothetical protein